ncbi:MAG TPA: hypothetical protein P5123_01210 [Spirochaetota bacterium]|nr:hypothetical protein [Spirochaetota bacterium]
MNDIVGHFNQLQHLRSLAFSQRLPQTFLFCGPAGIGKRKAADFFAALLVCQRKDEPPCGICSSCKSLQNGSSQDYIVLEPDEKGRIAVGSDNENGTVRWLTHRLTEKSSSGRYIVIIDGLDRISEAGQNILLKTVEEPGKGVVIIQISSSKSRVLPTILSRSMVINFHSLTAEQISKILKTDPEPHSYEDLALIVSGGSVSVTKDLIEKQILPPILDIASAIRETVINKAVFNENLSEFDAYNGDFGLYDILINMFHYNIKLVIEKKLQYNRYVEKFYIDDYVLLQRLIKRLLQLKNDLKFNVNSKYALKAALYEMSENI